MARTRDIKIDDKWVLFRFEPDWKRMNELAAKVDSGDYSVLDELVDLIIYEKETDAMMHYIDIAVERGNVKAVHIKEKLLNDYQKLMLFYKLSKINRADFGDKYKRERTSFCVFYGTVLILIISIIMMIYWLVS